MSWWNDHIYEPGKLPLALCLIAFVITFILTRVITRLIRMGRGPFKNNVREDGLHIHHAVPGLVLLLAGAIMSLATLSYQIASFAGLLVGAGASLVLDEFALILHLDDVYWAKEGRASVQAVVLTATCLGFMLLGVTPASAEDLTGGDAYVRWTVIAGLVLSGVCCAICARKGKYRLVLLAVLIPVIAYAGAIRLARPGSPWFKRYPNGSRRQRRAIERAAWWDRHVDARLTWFGDLIAGSPSADIPAPSAGDRASS